MARPVKYLPTHDFHVLLNEDRRYKTFNQDIVVRGNFIHVLDKCLPVEVSVTELLSDDFMLGLLNVLHHMLRKGAWGYSIGCVISDSKSRKPTRISRSGAKEQIFSVELSDNRVAWFHVLVYNQGCLRYAHNESMKQKGYTFASFLIAQRVECPLSFVHANSVKGERAVA